MSKTTWIFVISCITVIFPVIMVLTNNYFDTTPADDEYDDIDINSSFVDKILDFLKINDFMEAMGNIPQPVRGIVYTIWFIMIFYILIQLIPFIGN